MVWQIKFDASVEKDLKKLDISIQKKIIDFLKNKVSKSPRDIGKPLIGKLKNLWRYRLNDYRIICRIEDSSLIVLVVAVGHRKNVYK